MEGEASPVTDDVVEAAARRAAELVDPDRVVELARLMVTTASLPGQEESLARLTAAWGAEHHPDLSWDVHPHGPGRASLVSRAGSSEGSDRELAWYGHLDIGWSPERPRNDPPGFSHDADRGTIAGLGLGVAKGPSAAATVAYAAVATALAEAELPHRSLLLLAAGGTHVAPPPGDGDGTPTGFGVGLDALLRMGVRPTAVINAKAGPNGVLHEEPGCLYLHVALRGRPLASVIDKRAEDGQLGVISLIGPAIEAVDAWRRDFLARDTADSQIAREVIVGAVRCGRPPKPEAPVDTVDLYLYVVTGVDDHPGEICASLERHLRNTAGTGGQAAAEVVVAPYAFAPAGRTDPSAEIVGLARSSWARMTGRSGDVHGYKGSTDGVLFRQLGIDCVRIGGTFTRPDHDARVSAFPVDALVQVARIQADVAVRYLARSLGGAAGR